MPSKIEVPDIHKRIEEYRSGLSVGDISRKLGISARAIERVLKQNGVQLRSLSEALRFRLQNAGPEVRKAQVAAAQQAVRVKGKISEEERHRRAKLRQKNPGLVSLHEEQLVEILKQRGFNPTTQFAIGPYNCDLIMDSVAMEIYARNWNFSNGRSGPMEERTRYILNAGWHVILIRLEPGRGWCVNDALADNLISEIKELCSNPSPIRQYRVIWRAGQFTSGGTADDEHLSFIPPFRSTRNPRTGRYETIPR